MALSQSLLQECGAGRSDLPGLSKGQKHGETGSCPAVSRDGPVSKELNPKCASCGMG